MESILASAFGCTFALGNSAVRADADQSKTRVDSDAARHDVSRDASGLVNDHSRPALRWVALIARRFVKQGGWDVGSLRIAGAIGWATCCCESGPGAWLMQPQWTLKLRNQCIAADVPFLFKRWGVFRPKSSYASLTEPSVGPDLSIRIGKKSAGRLPDGIEHSGCPHLLA